MNSKLLLLILGTLYTASMFAQKPAIINTTRSHVKNIAAPMKPIQENSLITKSTNPNSTVSKKTIYTLKPEEKLYMEESFISFSAIGEQCEFTTILNNQFFLHTNGKDFGPFRSAPWRISPMKYICQSKNIADNSYETWYIDLSTGKKTGPFQRIEYWSYLINPNPNGFKYQKNDNFFVRVFGRPTDLGPYDQVNLLILSDTRTEFVYQKDDDFYIYNNGNSTGPFKNLQMAYSESAYPTYSYQEKNGKYFISLQNKSFGPFNSMPQYCYSSAKNDPKYFISEPNGIYKGYYLLKDGSKVPGNDPGDLTSRVYNFEPGSWIKLEKTDIIKAKSEGKTINCSSNAPWNVTLSEGQQFGPITIGDEYGNACFSENDFLMVAANPPTMGCDLITGKSNINSGKSSYYFLSKKGLEGPIDDTKGLIKKASSGKSKSGFIINNKLYIDKKFTGLDNVYDFNFANPSVSDNWYACVKAATNDSIHLYINGNKVHSISSQGSTYDFVSVNTSSDFCFSYTVNQSFYFKSSFSKEFGPYEKLYLYYNAPIMLPEKKAIAYIANYTDIIINGQNKGEGTALTCNYKNKNFHWMSTDGKTILFNSYRP